MSNTLKKYDFILIGLYLTMLILGLFNLYSSDYQNIIKYSNILQSDFGKQIMWILLSIGIAIFLLIIDSVAFSMFAYIFYIGTIILLFLVLFFGEQTHGAQAWFHLGFIKIQPSEFAKSATALVIAKLMSINKLEWKLKNWQDISTILIIIALPMALILLQPDVGSAIVFSSFLFVFYREGMPGEILILVLISIIVFILALILPQITVLATIIAVSIIFMFLFLNAKSQILRIILIFAIIFSTFYFLNILFNLKITFLYIILITTIIWAVYLFIYFLKIKEKAIPIIIVYLIASIFVQFSTNFAYEKILKPHQRERIDVLFNASANEKESGYNLIQSKIAIGSGGFKGKGYLKGTQVQLKYVPEHNTDFIFCNIAEEWGFMGTLVIFILYAFLIIRIILKAEQQRSDFSRIYGYSVASIFFFHFMVNIGMTIGLVPVIGIPLPFISYGGSAMVGFTTLLFIFIKLDSDKDLQL